MAAVEQSVPGLEQGIERASALPLWRAVPNGGSSAAAFQRVWTPAFVDECGGELGYSQSAARQKLWRQRQPRGSREAPPIPPMSPATHRSYTRRPQNVPRMYEHDDEDSDSSELGRAPAYLHPFARSNVNHSEKFDERAENENGRPTRRELRDELWHIGERAREYPRIQMEVHQLQQVTNVIQTKEVWMEARMQEIQRLRLAMQKQYVTKLKSNPALLGRTHREQTHEEKLFLGEEVQEDTLRVEVPATGAPTRRNGKRRADESELVENASRKRLRNAV
ncbi:hypothetical protein C8Q74DRAFT_1449279 [Fomes fomentarius]|nr:hypothetical protein C8Q74DRAFT_1449279 [Fomes fomentarius]